MSVRVEIRRSCVVKDALREAQKSKFNPRGLLKVCLTYISYSSHLNNIHTITYFS